MSNKVFRDSVRGIKSASVELQAQIAKAKKEIQKKGQAELKALFQALFDAVPELERVRWTQFTPYFNDGDECTFGVNECYFMLKQYPPQEILHVYKWSDQNGKKSEVTATPDYDENGDYVNSKSRGTKNGYFSAGSFKENSVLRITFNEFEGVFSGLEDALETIFGDHAQITATRKGFDVEEYVHE